MAEARDPAARFASPPQPQRHGRVLDGKRETRAPAVRAAGWAAGGVEASGATAALAERMEPVVADVQVESALRAAGARGPLEHAVAGAAPEDERRGAGTAADRNLARVDLGLDDGRRDQLGAEPRGEPVAQLGAPRLEVLGKQPALGVPPRPLLDRARTLHRPRHLGVQARVVVGHAEEVAP